MAPDGKYFDWITNLKVQKHALDGTFFVHVFLGEFNRDDPLSWRSDPNLVGTFSIFGDTVGTGCKKCKRDRENQLQITGQVPLTLALAERYLAGEIENLTPEKVVPYLQTHLHWRVATVSTYPRILTAGADLMTSVTSTISYFTLLRIPNAIAGNFLQILKEHALIKHLSRAAASKNHVERSPISSSQSSATRSSCRRKTMNFRHTRKTCMSILNAPRPVMVKVEGMELVSLTRIRPDWFTRRQVIGGATCKWEC